MEELTQRAVAVERNIQGQYDNFRAQLGPLSMILAGATGDVSVLSRRRRSSSS